MASAGPNNPGTLANDASNFGDVAWANPSNAAAADGAYSSAVLDIGGDGIYSQYLWVTNFGFSIPGGATINGVVVEVKRYCTVAGVTDDNLELIVGGAVGASENKSGGAWATSLQYDSFGGAADGWSASLTAAQVNASNFGVAIACHNAGGGASTANVDHVRVTVYYTEAGGSVAPLAVHHRKQQGAA